MRPTSPPTSPILTLCKRWILDRDENGSLYIVMELVVGVPLSRVLKEANKVRKAVPVGMGIELVAQAGAGLDAAHEATTAIGEPLHIVHRDVSPQNILVGVDGRVRLTDFGVARAVLRMTKTDAGRIKGKFAYCAPEQLRSEQIDRRADIFALGVVAWETLAGQRLFVAEHPLATMERVTTMPILPLDQLRSKVPKPVSDVVLWALEREVGKRPPSASAFVRELRNAALQSGLELPGPADITRFVQAAGGEPLRKMQNNIRVALAASEADVLGDSSQFQLIDEQSSSSVTSGIDTSMERQLQELSHPDSSGVSRVPGSLIPPEAEAVEEPPSRKGLFIGLGVAAAALMIIGGYFAFRPTEVEVEALPPIAASNDTVEAAEPPQPAVAQPSLPDDDSTMGSVPGVGSDEASAPDEDEGQQEGAAAMAPTSAMARRPRRRPSRMSSAMAVAPTVETPPAPMVEMTAPMAAPMSSPPAMTEPARMRGGLLGLDAFDTAAMRSDPAD